jgi:glycosyltransferase involved in cell wall biosynthesis
MAAGVPVVTSGRCGMPYLVRDLESGYLVDPHDPADAAVRFAELLAKPDLRRRQGETGAMIARDRFHPDQIARRTREVYSRAMAATARRAELALY